MAWTLERVRARCIIQQQTGCWLWQGARTRFGHGQVRIAGKTVYVHRLVASDFGQIDLPRGIEVCHRCSEPSCENPEHLYIGDRDSNAADMVRAGRSPIGERHGMHNLTEDRVRAIRRASRDGEANHSLAARYDVDPSTISQIIGRKRWAHVDL